jgi:heat-inducible transcriptional repressor
MLDDRKAAILRAIVQEYVETAQPVGSAHLARRPGLNVSSATIRNEMAVLEQEGYLSQPHTSAGRVPTDKGYRAFVDQMSGAGRSGSLDTAQITEVREFFAAAHGAVESMLHNTSRLLSHLTSYTAVVIAPPAELATVRSIQLVGLSNRVVLAVVVLSSGVVVHRNLELNEDTNDARIAAATAHLCAHLIGSAPGAVTAPSTGEPAVDTLVAAAEAIVHSELGSDAETSVFVGGTSNVAQSFDAAATVRAILRTLEQQYVVVGLLRDLVDRGVSVAIGAEHGVEPLAACSLVVAPYVIGGQPVGTVGVLGPTRMNYPQALAAVDVVSERLGRRLSES